MSHLKKYVEHCAGIYNFLAWIEEEKKIGQPYEISNQVIYLNQLISRYFSLGSVHGSKEIFLAIQPSECEWFRLISWNKVIIKENENNLYFLANLFPGDQKEQPDLPPFAISLDIDTYQKRKLISQLNILSGREYYKDEKGEINVNFHSKVFSLNVEIYDKNKPIIKDTEFVDYSHILAMKEHELKNTYIEIPNFIGDSSEAQKLLNKWSSKEKALLKNSQNL
jgi:hypothetical protein